MEFVSCLARQQWLNYPAKYPAMAKSAIQLASQLKKAHSLTSISQSVIKLLRLQIAVSCSHMCSMVGDTYNLRAFGSYTHNVHEISMSHHLRVSSAHLTHSAELSRYIDLLKICYKTNMRSWFTSMYIHMWPALYCMDKPAQHDCQCKREHCIDGWPESQSEIHIELIEASYIHTYPHQNILAQYWQKTGQVILQKRNETIFLQGSYKHAVAHILPCLGMYLCKLLLILQDFIFVKPYIRS